MARNDCEQILRAIKRKHDTFCLMQKGVMLDPKTGGIYIVREEYEGISSRSSGVVA